MAAVLGGVLSLWCSLSAQTASTRQTAAGQAEAGQIRFLPQQGTFVQLAPSSRAAAPGSARGQEIRLLNPSGGQMSVLTQVRFPVADLTVSPSGNLVGYLERRGQSVRLKVVEKASGREVPIGSRQVRKFAFSPDDRWVALIEGADFEGGVGFSAERVRVVDLQSRRSLQVLDEGVDLAWHPGDGSLNILTLEDPPRAVRQWRPGQQRSQPTDLEGIHFSPDGRYYYAAANEASDLRLFQAQGNRDITDRSSHLTSREFRYAEPKGWLAGSYLLLPASRKGSEHVYQASQDRSWRVEGSVIGLDLSRRVLYLQRNGQLQQRPMNRLQPSPRPAPAPRPPQSLDEALSMLRSGDPVRQDEGARGMAFLVARGWDEDNSRHVGTLVEALANRSAEVRSAAAAALSQLALTSRVAPAASAETKRNQASTAKALAAQAPRIAGRLGDREPSVRLSLTRVLSSVADQTAGDLRDSLAAALSRLALGGRERPQIRSEALRGLGRLGGSRARAAALRALRDDQALPRASAAAALGRMGASDQQSIQALRRALQDESNSVTLAAVRALGSMGNRAGAALGDLQRLEQDFRRKNHSEMCDEIRRCIGEIRNR